MYWLASPWTWTSISSSRWLPGRITFLVITAGAGKREGDVLDAGTEVLVGALNGFARRFDIGNVAIDDGVLRQRLDRVTFHTVNVTAGFRNLHHLDGRRTDVAARRAVESCPLGTRGLLIFL
jgi:hypothetical protein